MSLASHGNLGRYRVARRGLATIAALGLPLLSACSKADEVDHSDIFPAPTVAADPAALAQTLLRPLDSDVDPRMTMRFDALPPLGGTKPALHADEAAAMSALEQLWREASGARPNDVGAWLDVNERFLWLGWSPRAERAASVVLAVDAEHPRALALLAAAHTERGRRQRAAQLAEHALDSALRRSDAVPVLALVERARSLAGGDATSFLQAVETLREAMRVDPKRPEAPFFLGQLMLDANHFAGALPLLERASQHEPDPDGGKHATERLARTFAGLLEGRRPHARPADFAGLDVALERQPSLPAVEVLLGDGQGATVSGWFIVDSGASMTVLGPEAAHLLRRSATAQASVSTAAGNHAIEPCLLPLLQIGSLRLTDVPALLDDGQPRPIGPGIVGTLGVSLLRDFQLVLDLQRGRLQLLPPDGPLRLPPLAIPQNAVVRTGATPFELVHNLLLVQAQIGDGPERRFVFDTGADGLFVDPAVLSADTALDLGDPRLRRTITVGLGGREVANLLVPLPVPLHFGGIPFRGIVAITDALAASRAAAARLDHVGSFGLLVSARYGIDFVSQRVLFEITIPAAAIEGTGHRR